VKRLLGLDRTLLWALRGLLRVFVRTTVVPEDALVRLHGRARPLLYVLEERSVSDQLALEQACMDGGLRRNSRVRLPRLATIRHWNSISYRSRSTGAGRRSANAPGCA